MWVQSERDGARTVEPNAPADFDSSASLPNFLRRALWQNLAALVTLLCDSVRCEHGLAWALVRDVGASRKPTCVHDGSVAR
jgi:hypothetical protein